MFANKRINNAAGLINIPAISIGTKYWVQSYMELLEAINICFQNPFL